MNKNELELEDMFRIMREMDSGEFYAKFERCKERIREMYLKDSVPFMIGFSSGKDSSLVLQLVMEMLQDLKPNQRHKVVHVISANTKVETYQMTSFLKKNLSLIKQKCQELNMQIHLVLPSKKNTFAYNVIGKGYPMPTPKGGQQWCTDKFKITPMDVKLKQLIIDIPGNHKMTMLLGSRDDESARRASSINKHLDEGEFLGRHAEYKEIKVFYPIKDILTADLWQYFALKGTLAWGLSYEELHEMYSDGKECPIMQKEENASPCGQSNSRNGCYVCLYAGREDKMLETLIENGYEQVEYLADFKKYLYDVRNDIRYREPLNRKEFQGELNNAIKQFNLIDDPGLTELELSYKYHNRTDKTVYKPGGFTFELRLKLLQKLLYAQQESGYELIDEKDLMSIVEVWNEEGYSFSAEDIVPIDHQHDGGLVFTPTGKVNEKETNVLAPVYAIDIKFDIPSDKIIQFVRKRQQLTGKSYFCFLNYEEYSNIKYVTNVLTFIICHPLIETENQAMNALNEFLFPDIEEIAIKCTNNMVKSKNETLHILENILSQEHTFLGEWLHNEKRLAKKLEEAMQIQSREGIPLYPEREIYKQISLF